MTPARLAGIFYLLTFVSIPTLALYAAVLKPGYVLGDGPDTAALVGGVLEIVVALACIGTAVALYPILKRHNEGIALGFIGARTLEAATIFAGAASLLAVVANRVCTIDRSSAQSSTIAPGTAWASGASGSAVSAITRVFVPSSATRSRISVVVPDRLITSTVS